MPDRPSCYRPEVRAVLIYSVDARFAVTLRIEEGARADGVTRASMLFAGGEDFGRRVAGRAQEKPREANRQAGRRLPPSRTTKKHRQRPYPGAFI